jgi:hypothetical protein
MEKKFILTTELISLNENLFKYFKKSSRGISFELVITSAFPEGWYEKSEQFLRFAGTVSKEKVKKIKGIEVFTIMDLMSECASGVIKKYYSDYPLNEFRVVDDIPEYDVILKGHFFKPYTLYIKLRPPISTLTIKPLEEGLEEIKNKDVKDVKKEVKKGWNVFGFLKFLKDRLKVKKQYEKNNNSVD